MLEGLCPPYVTDMDAAVDQVLEEKFGPGGTYTNAEVFAQSYKDKATAETYMKHAGHPPAEAIEYTKEICRYLVETYGRFPAHTDAVPPARHLGAVLAPGDRVLRAVREPAATSSAQAEGREIWDRDGERGERPRPDDRPDAASRRSAGSGCGCCGSACRSRGTCRSWRATSCSSTSSSSCAGRSCAGLDGERLHYPYLFFESNFDGPWQHYIDAFAYVIPQDIRVTWGRGPGFPAPPPAEPLKAWIAHEQHGGRHVLLRARRRVDADGQAARWP